MNSYIEYQVPPLTGVCVQEGPLYALGVDSKLLALYAVECAVWDQKPFTGLDEECKGFGMEGKVYAGTR